MRLDHALAPRMGPKVRAALDALGRTEDVCFSPDGRRLALAGFDREVVAVADVEISPTGPRRASEAVEVSVGGLLELTAPGLDLPHGLDWIDGATLAVANRDGGVVLLPVPSAGEGVELVAVEPVEVDGGFGEPAGPGSLTVIGRRDGDGRADGSVDLLVCQNWANALTRHRIERGEPIRIAPEEIWLRRHLDVPDGVAVSDDGRWVAVSNHNEQVVLLYDATTRATADERTPVGVLRGVAYPHGLRFTPDGCHLLVADAGAPFVHVFRAGDDRGWAVADHAVAVHRVVDDATFLRGRSRPDEGGPKGIDLDPTGRVLVATCEEQPLAVFDLAALLDHPVAASGEQRASYEIAVLDRVAATKAELATARHDALAAEVREHDARAEAARAADHVRHVEEVAAEADGRARDAAARAEAAEFRAVELRAEADALRVRADDVAAHLEALQATRVLRLTAGARRAYGAARRRILARR